MCFAIWSVQVCYLFTRKFLWLPLIINCRVSIQYGASRAFCRSQRPFKHHKYSNEMLRGSLLCKMLFDKKFSIEIKLCLPHFTNKKPYCLSKKFSKLSSGLCKLKAYEGCLHIFNLTCRKYTKLPGLVITNYK